jgi:hypothetical protein
MNIVGVDSHGRSEASRKVLMSPALLVRRDGYLRRWISHKLTVAWLFADESSAHPSQALPVDPGLEPLPPLVATANA